MLPPEQKPRPSSRRSRLAAAALGALVLALGGCAEQHGQTFFVAFSLALEDDCRLAAVGGQISLRPRGTLDIALTNQYFLFATVLNPMPLSSEVTGASPEHLLLENNNIQIEGGRLRYIVGDIGIDLPQDQFVFVSGTVAPGARTLIQVPVIPPLVGEFLRQAPLLQGKYSLAEVVAQLTLSGRLQDGTRIESRTFIFPIDVCNGCLIQYNVAPEFCCDPVSWEGTGFIPCFPGQDDGLDCRLCCATAVTDEEKQKCLP